MKILHLTIKKKWFDMIASGEKKEEYREIKTHWIKRLVNVSYPLEEENGNNNIASDIEFDVLNGHDPNDVLKSYFTKCKEFDVVRFTHGYAKDAPTLEVRCNGITIDYGMLTWGAEKDKKYFIIHLGEILTPLK